MNFKLQNAIVLCCCLASGSALGIPFHGCTFFKPHWLPFSWPGGFNTGCADFQMLPGACTIHHKYYSHPGVEYSAYLPEYFDEVVSRPGTSAFAVSADSAALAVHLKVAEKYWLAGGASGGGDLNPMAGAARNDLYFDGKPFNHNKSMYFGRVLGIPYGSIAWNFPLLGWSGGSAIPGCYKGISELAPLTWSDSLASGDRTLAQIWAGYNAAVCSGMSPLAGALESAMQAVSSLPIPRFTVPSGGCAIPLPAVAEQGLAYTGELALNPVEQCKGVLGGVLPRTGISTFAEQGVSWELIAWRTMLLTRDFFKTATTSFDDKWQLIWPKMANHMCFRPGGLNRPTHGEPTTLRWDKVTGLPIPAVASFVAEAAGPLGQGQWVPDAVYAIWRKRTKCVEPYDAPAVTAAIFAQHALLVAGCNAISATDGVLGYP